MRWPPWEELDHFRRWLGDRLDASDLIPPTETPFRVVFAEPVMTQKAFTPSGDTGPVILLVSAPIKRAYIWDLVPWASVVQQCLRSGARVYLAQWEAPSEAEQGFGLAEYADRLIFDYLQAIAADCEQRQAFLVSHSLGRVARGAVTQCRSPQ